MLGHLSVVKERNMLLKSFFAFIIGGLFCALAQIIIDKTKITPARTLVIFVLFGIFLGGIGLYKTLFDFCGCGISLPLIGYGGTIAEGVKEAVRKEGLLGALKGPFTASSAGCALALISGYLASLFSRGKSKRL